LPRCCGIHIATLHLVIGRFWLLYLFGNQTAGIACSSSAAKQPVCAQHRDALARRRRCAAIIDLARADQSSSPPRSSAHTSRHCERGPRVVTVAVLIFVVAL
jgi:hypothetical protein